MLNIYKLLWSIRKVNTRRNKKCLWKQKLSNITYEANTLKIKKQIEKLTIKLIINLIKKNYIYQDKMMDVKLHLKMLHKNVSRDAFYVK